jgi:DNA helicase-2/ATP-dependent DNA helicase PcrA
VDLLSTLNPRQREAVAAPDGPVLVLAGPGSGKTRVLTHRIAHLIYERDVRPYNIVAVTFTNKAAGEMKERVERLIEGRVRGLRIGTFHALCARILRIEADDHNEGVLSQYNKNYLIYDTADQRSVVKQAVTDVGVNLKRLNLTDYSVLNRISDAKNELVQAEQYPSSTYEDEVIKRIYEQYQILLRNSNAMDFDDLIMNTVRLLEDHPDTRHTYQNQYQHVLVDEFQDTNMAQYRLVRLWGMPQQNVFVVGDEDQAIYAFRGADYRNVMRFRKDYGGAKVVLLEQNYRSTQIILDAARAVIDRNQDRTPKKLFTDRRDALKIHAYEAYDEREEAEFIVKEVSRLERSGTPTNEIAVMYRTNMQSRVLEQICVENRVPYQVIGGVAFYQRREVKDLMAYLRLIESPGDVVSFNRIINTPKRGIGAKTQAAFQVWADSSGMTYGEALLKLTEDATVPELSAGVNRKLATFGDMLKDWRRLADQGDFAVLIDDILEQTEFDNYLATTSKTDEELYDRRGNVDELRGYLDSEEIESLSDFLTNASLSTDLDTSDPNADKITLLTLHASKGLEYDAVFLTGLEDGILPHSRSLDDIDGIAEERRLLYVGITRARHRLYMTRAFRRRLGQYAEPREPSRFLYDLPATLLEGSSSEVNQRRQTESFYRSTTWHAMSDNEFMRASRKARHGDPDDKIVSFPGATAEPQFRSGLRVRHAKFGEGMVIESKASSGDEEVTVAFESAGIKRLMASFANLEVLDG